MKCLNKSSAVAEMGDDRGHNRHWPKIGGGAAMPLSRDRREMFGKLLTSTDKFILNSLLVDRPEQTTTLEFYKRAEPATRKS